MGSILVRERTCGHADDVKQLQPVVRHHTCAPTCTRGHTRTYTHLGCVNVTAAGAVDDVYDLWLAVARHLQARRACMPTKCHVQGNERALAGVIVSTYARMLALVLECLNQ